MTSRLKMLSTSRKSLSGQLVWLSSRCDDLHRLPLSWALLLQLVHLCQTIPFIPSHDSQGTSLCVLTSEGTHPQSTPAFLPVNLGLDSVKPGCSVEEDTKEPLSGQDKL